MLSELLGIQPQADDSIEIHPIVPSSWNYFIVENLPYHGHNVTVVYDVDGSKYDTGYAGLQVFVNGEYVASQAGLGKMRVPVPTPVIQDFGGKSRNVEDYAANP